MQPVTYLLLDLDGTLYPDQVGLWAAIKERIGRYLVERLGFSPAEAQALRAEYVRRYGTTLRGLQLHHGVEPRDFLDYVHDLPLEDFLQPDPRLRAALLALPQPKWVFTNADQSHTWRVLHILGVADLFAGVIDLLDTEFHPKPDPHAFAVALQRLGDPPPEQVAVVDDLPRNTRAARQLGFFTVLIAPQPDPEAAHLTLPDVYHLVQLPQLRGVHVD